MSRDWNENDERVLVDAEKFLRTATAVLMTIDLWTDNLGDEVEPDGLVDELKLRVTKVMWKVSMLRTIIDKDGPSDALKSVLEWVQAMRPGDVVVKEFNNLDEFNRAIGRNGKEGNKGGGGYL